MVVTTFLAISGVAALFVMHVRSRSVRACVSVAVTAIALLVTAALVSRARTLKAMMFAVTIFNNINYCERFMPKSIISYLLTVLQKITLTC